MIDRQCDVCGRMTATLAKHRPACARKRVVIERAGSHAAPIVQLRPDQKLLSGVTDLDVARVMHGLESGVRLYLNGSGKWLAPSGVTLAHLPRLSATVREMIRTGLVRHWRDREGDHLVPAKVHLLGEGARSACHFPGEDLGPMRSRLAKDPALVDCQACLDHASRTSLS